MPRWFAVRTLLVQPFPDEGTSSSPNTQPVTLSTPYLLPLTDGTASVPATDSSTAGYPLTFKIPNLAAGATTNQETCVISLLDQRNWGGCVDIIKKQVSNMLASLS